MLSIYMVQMLNSKLKRLQGKDRKDTQQNHNKAGVAIAIDRNFKIKGHYREAK